MLTSRRSLVHVLHVKLNMWSWNQCVLIVSCQSGDVDLAALRRASRLGIVAAVLIVRKPARRSARIVVE